MYVTPRQTTNKLLEIDAMNDLIKLQQRIFFANQLLGSLDASFTKSRQVITRNIFSWTEQQARILKSLER